MIGPGSGRGSMRCASSETRIAPSSGPSAAVASIIGPLQHYSTRRTSICIGPADPWAVASSSSHAPPAHHRVPEHGASRLVGRGGGTYQPAWLPSIADAAYFVQQGMTAVRFPAPPSRRGWRCGTAKGEPHGASHMGRARGQRAARASLRVARRRASGRFRLTRGWSPPRLVG
jgi:hypothetical protein